MGLNDAWDRSKKIEMAIFVVALVALVAIWAMNGFDDTWLYAVLIAVIIPTAWFRLRKKSKDPGR